MRKGKTQRNKEMQYGIECIIGAISTNVEFRLQTTSMIIKFWLHCVTILLCSMEFIVVAYATTEILKILLISSNSIKNSKTQIKIQPCRKPKDVFNGLLMCFH